jgi:hypothetical protein
MVCHGPQMSSNRAIEQLELDVLTGMPGFPRGTVHSWGLMYAVRNCLQFDEDAKARVHAVLRTGMEELERWLEARAAP